MVKEMKPCPKCHSDRVTLVYEAGDKGEKTWLGHCNDCGLKGPSSYDGSGYRACEEAISLWNSTWNLVEVKQPAKPDEVTAPAHYAGDGSVTCKDAVASMAAGYDKGGVTSAQAYWSIAALKYLWRWPLKGSPLKDLKKARECLDLAIAAVEGGDRHGMRSDERA